MQFTTTLLLCTMAAPATVPTPAAPTQPTAVIEIAADASAQSLIDIAREDLKASRWSKAAAFLHAARARLDAPSPVLAYDEGIAAYQAGDLSAAAAAFDAALNASTESSSTPSLIADAHFNRGNVAVDQAVLAQEGGETNAAMTQLVEALGHYRQAIVKHDPRGDARANAQLAWQRLQQLIEQKQQEEQEQDQEQQQDESEESSQDDQDDAQSQDNEQHQSPEPQEGQDEPQQDEQQDEQEPQQDQQQPDTDQRDEQQQPEPEGQQQQSQGPHQAQPLTREEAERLLQRVRDRERARVQEEAAETPGTPVTGKDW
jgi:Ca-activated chloride channel family protein